MINIEAQCIRTSSTSFHGTPQEHVVGKRSESLLGTIDCAGVIFLTHSNIMYWHAWESASWKLAFHAVIQSHLCVVIIKHCIPQITTTTLHSTWLMMMKILPPLWSITVPECAKVGDLHYSDWRMGT